MNTKLNFGSSFLGENQFRIWLLVRVLKSLFGFSWINFYIKTFHGMTLYRQKFWWNILQQKALSSPVVITIQSNRWSVTVYLKLTHRKIHFVWSHYLISFLRPLGYPYFLSPVERDAQICLLGNLYLVIL